MTIDAKTVETGVWTVEESVALSSLTIAPGASLAAPAGKYLTLTVNGVGTPIAPGTYTGDVRLTVCDEFIRRSLRFGEETVSSFHAGAIVNDGKIVRESSVPAVIQGGSVTDTEANDIQIESSEWDFNGFYITGKTGYTINNADISLVGDGTDDFVGMGAGIAVAGDADVTVNNTRVHTEGIGRGTLFVGGNGTVTLNDCAFSTVSHVPTKEELEEGIKQGRMMEPPWSIGICGNGRTLNVAGHGTLNLNRCHMTSNSWGVLSVDGAIVNRMNVKDSLIENTGKSGYGCFSICDDFMFDYKAFGDYGCYDTIDHSVFNVPYTAILMSLGNSGGEFKNGAVVNSKRFGAFIHRNSGGMLRINSGSQFNTGSSCIVVKGSNTYFELDGAVMKPGNGTILQLMDNDDAGMGAKSFLIPVGETDVRDNRDLTVAIPDEDVFMTVSNMEAEGNFLNSTTNLMACNRVEEIVLPEGAEPPVEMPAPQIPMGPDGKPVLRGFVGEDLMGAKNLDIKLVNASVTGLISAAVQSYKEGLTRITEENREELSNVTQTPAPPVNNGVIVSMDEKSKWTLTGTCYLTRLTVAKGAVITGPDGKAVKLTVNGAETEFLPGDYCGMLKLSI